jgi:OOP family OmpA-OmpF porin
MQFAFTPSLLMRAEAERYRTNTATGTRGDINVLSVSLVMPLGRGSRTMRSAAYTDMRPPMTAIEPVVVVQAVPQPEPMPPPVVMVVEPVARALPPPPQRQRVSYSAESMFGFDQSSLQEPGKQALDGFTVELRGAQFETVTVEGHTDRLGSTAYNQALSQQRADVVKNYLVDSGGLPAAKVSARGMGESAPVSQTADCKGERASKTLISCLQPDRRVDIEVTGSR